MVIMSLLADADANTSDLTSSRLQKMGSHISGIKNKSRRTEAYKKYLAEKRKLNVMKRKKAKEHENHLKEKGISVRKAVPKTIESMRVPDATMISETDDEVLKDISIDEISPYFDRKTTPKLLLTTSDRPKRLTKSFVKEFKRCLPNCFSYTRSFIPLKKLIPQAVRKEFSDIVVINDDVGTPNGMLLIHLPNGPTAHFKLSSVRLSKHIKHSGKPEESFKSEVILNNFNTRLGASVGRMLAALFPHNPDFNGRQVVTFHNQRDYIFFRFHRYRFKDEKKVGLQELGPRFTLKLRSLQLGTFDSKFGEYEWFHRRHEMETSRRKFFL